jgi:hypothetical protein
VKVCQDNGIKWFEDQTNTDPTLTIRNTFRHLIKHEQLPLALSKERLARAAAYVSTKHDQVEAAASRFFNSMRLALDLRSGIATFDIPKTSEGDDRRLDAKFHGIVVRKMLHLVSFKSNISLQDLDAAVDLIFDPENSQGKTPVLIAGVEIRKESSLSTSDSSVSHGHPATFTFRRQIPSSHERKVAHITIWPPPQYPIASKWSEWALWDGRYWIRVRRPERDLDPNLRITLKFLTKRYIELLRREVSPAEKDQINRRLEAVKGSTRFTLPAIVAEKPGVTDQVVALPTIHWCVEGWQRDKEVANPECWIWDIRYKHVDLNRRHRVLS